MSQAIWQARMLRLPLIWATLILISLRLLARLGVLLNSKMILVNIGFHHWQFVMVCSLCAQVERSVNTIVV